MGERSAEAHRSAHPGGVALAAPAAAGLHRQDVRS